MLTLACRGVNCGGQGGVTPCQSLHTFFWEESMSPSRLERQTACSMHFNPKGQRPFVGKRLSTARKSHRRPGEGRGLPFLLREERAQRSGKGTALVPFQTPTKFRCRKRCGTTALVNPPAGNLCAAVQSARSGACPKQSAPWSPVRAVPPSTATELCSLWRVAE